MARAALRDAALRVRLDATSAVQASAGALAGCVLALQSVARRSLRRRALAAAVIQRRVRRWRASPRDTGARPCVARAWRCHVARCQLARQREHLRRKASVAIETWTRAALAPTLRACAERSRPAAARARDDRAQGASRAS